VQLLKSLVFTAWLFVGTALYAVVVLLLGWLPGNRIYAVARSWSRSQLWVLKTLCGLDFRVEGLENVPSGTHVSMWKHSSAWETIAQAAILPPQAWVLKRELMWIPLVGWAIHFMKPIAINRKAGAAAINQVIQQGTERLKSGLWILIFPEGTRTAIGETRRYGVSGALLASRARCKVLPIAHNAGYFWPRRGWLKKPGIIRVVIGPPIEAADRDPREINEDAKRWIETTVAAIAPTPPLAADMRGSSVVG
jgi:1-acyl-sn-glycerol-3-phosphate acyltransferase